jgi:uncharacterized membrane protein
LKTDLTLGAISNAVNPRPVAGLMDMVVLVTLLRQIAEDPWTEQNFGADAAYLVQSLKRQEADIRAMAKRYLTDENLLEIGALAQKWHQAHPEDCSVSHVHLADLPEANRPPEEAGKLPSSVFALLFFDPTSNLDPAVREIQLSRATSERMFFYVQRLPLLLQLQGESFYRQLLTAPAVGRVLQDASAIAGSTTRFAETSSRFTDVVERFPQQFSREREQTLTQIAAELTQERDATIRQLADAVTAQREAAIRQLTEAVAAQREAAIRQLSEAVLQQRDAAIVQATTQVTLQREQTIGATTGLLRQERQALVADLQAATARSIDRLLVGLALVGLVVVAVALGAALVYRRLLERRMRP